MAIKKLFYKFFLLFILISLIPLGGYVFIRSFQLKSAISGNSEQRLRNYIKSVANNVDNFFVNHKSSVEIFSKSVIVKNFLSNQNENGRQIDIFIEEIKKIRPKTYSIVYMLDAKGKCVASTNKKLVGKNYSFRPYFKKVKRGNVYISEITIGVTTKKAGIYMSSPVYLEGDFVGVAVIKLNAAILQNIINEAELKHGHLFLVDINSVVIAHQLKKYLFTYTKKFTESEKNEINRKKQYPKNFLKKIKIQGFPNDKYFETDKIYDVKIEDTKYIALFNKIKSKNYLIGALKKKSIFYQELNDAIAQAFILSGIIFILTIITAFFIARIFTSPIKKITAMSEKLANNNLDIAVENPKRKDEIGVLFNSMKLLHQNIAEIVSFMNVISNYINTTSKDVNKSSDQTFYNVNKIISEVESQYAMLNAQNKTLNKITEDINTVANKINYASEHAENQKEKISRSADAIKHVAENVKHSFDIMKQSKDISESLQNVAKQGYDTIHNALQGMNEVSGFTKRINDVIDVIQNITEQTNLLAMNAAIEAAHAGSAGKGFAVVASEIRKLAMNASKSANEITTIVRDITSKVAETNVLAEKAVTGLDKILVDVNKNNDINQDVFKSIMQQSSDIKNVFNFIEEIIQISDGFLITIREVKQSIEQVNKNSEDLNNASGNINKAIHGNIAIVQNLNDSAEKVSVVSKNLKDIAKHFQDAVARFYISKDKVVVFEENINSDNNNEGNDGDLDPGDIVVF